MDGCIGNHFLVPDLDSFTRRFRRPSYLSHESPVAARRLFHRCSGHVVKDSVPEWIGPVDIRINPLPSLSVQECD